MHRPDSSGGQVVLAGLLVLIPEMRQPLLAFPELCQSFFALVGQAVELYPHEVARLSGEPCTAETPCWPLAPSICRGQVPDCHDWPCHQASRAATPACLVYVSMHTRHQLPPSWELPSGWLHGGQRLLQSRPRLQRCIQCCEGCL